MHVIPIPEPPILAGEPFSIHDYGDGHVALVIGPDGFAPCETILIGEDIAYAIGHALMMWANRGR